MSFSHHKQIMWVSEFIYTNPLYQYTFFDSHAKFKDRMPQVEVYTHSRNLYMHYTIDLI